MPIEAVTYISDLNPANPVGSTDKVQTLDDHVRNIKSALLNTFPNITGAVTLTQGELNHLADITWDISDAARKSQSNTFALQQTINGAQDVQQLTLASPTRRLFFLGDSSQNNGAIIYAMNSAQDAFQPLRLAASAIELAAPVTLNGIPAT